MTETAEIEIVIKLPAAIKEIADSLGLSLGEVSTEMVKSAFDGEIDTIQEMDQHETGSILVDAMIRKLNAEIQRKGVIEWVGRIIETTAEDGNDETKNE